MKSKSFKVSFVIFFLLSATAHSFQQNSSTSIDDHGNEITTFTNTDDEGNQYYGGQVINYADGSSQQFRSDDKIMSGWGGGQDSYRVEHGQYETSGQAFQLYIRTSASGEEYYGGHVQEIGNRSYQYDSAGSLMNEW